MAGACVSHIFEEPQRVQVEHPPAAAFSYQLLPFIAEVQKHNYLDEKQQQYQHDLESEASSQNWARLAKVTLAQVVLVNRRREGEVSKMSLSAFTSRDTSGPHEDINLALSSRKSSAII